MSRKTYTDGQQAHDAHSGSTRRLRVIRGASRWEPIDPDGGATVLQLPKRPKSFTVFSASGKLIGRFIVRRDAIAALYFWPQASYIVSGGQVIAQKASEADEAVGIARAA